MKEGFQSITKEKERFWGFLGFSRVSIFYIQAFRGFRRCFSGVFFGI